MDEYGIKPEEENVPSMVSVRPPRLAQVLIVLNFFSLLWIFALGVIVTVGEFHMSLKMDEPFAEELFDYYLIYAIPSYVFYAVTFWGYRLFYLRYYRKSGDPQYVHHYSGQSALVDTIVFLVITGSTFTSLFVYGTGNSFAVFDTVQQTCQC